MRKLKIFLENIQDIDENGCKKFLKDSENNNASFSASLLLILDKIEDERKAMLIANVFKLYVKERFSYDMFNKLLLIINRGFCSDLLSIIHFEHNDTLLTDGKIISADSLSELFSCGLLDYAGIDGGNADGGGGMKYSLNEYGKTLLRSLKAVEF